MHDDRWRALSGRRLLRRLYAIVIALVVGSTIVYGQTWLLEESSTAAMQCAVTTSIARAIDAETAAN
jgi:hypothetical protein